MSTLDTKANAELSELFAVHVAKIWRVETPRDGGIRAYSVIRTGAWREIHEGRFPPEDLDDYATSADAVLPWLEKARAEDRCHVSCGLSYIMTLGLGWGVRIIDNATNKAHVGVASTFARAAVIALLRYRATS